MTALDTWQSQSAEPLPSGSVAPPSYSAAAGYAPTAAPAGDLGSNPSQGSDPNNPLPSGARTNPTYSQAPGYNPSAPPAPSLTAGPQWKPSTAPPLPSGARTEPVFTTTASTTLPPVPPPIYAPAVPGPETGDPPMTTNFMLIIDGLTCGRWTECSGLGMKYKTQAYQPGGSITSTQVLMQKDLQTLTVTRPFGGPSIEMLHWFELYAHITIPLTATVIACDFMCNPLYYWELEGVVPVEWNGPKFKAGETAPVTEVLKLTYTDFLAYGSWDLAGAIGGAIEATATVAEAVIGALAGPKLTKIDSSGTPGSSITFDIVPNTFTITNSVTAVQKKSVGTAKVAQQSTGPKARTLAFDFVVDSLTIGIGKLTDPLGAISGLFDGVTSQLEFVSSLSGNTLFTKDTGGVAGVLSSALGGLTGGGSDSGPALPPAVQFTWGDFNFTGWMTTCSIKITVLGLTGTPQRATVGMTLTEVTSDFPGQNPTSGAAGATMTHTVIAGDSLASISFATYGHADRWRGIADLNGIDDPLRVKAGTTLLLPSASDARSGK